MGSYVFFNKTVFNYFAIITNAKITSIDLSFDKVKVVAKFR